MKKNRQTVRIHRTRHCRMAPEAIHRKRQSPEMTAQIRTPSRQRVSPVRKMSLIVRVNLIRKASPAVECRTEWTGSHPQMEVPITEAPPVAGCLLAASAAVCRPELPELPLIAAARV